ncbi:cytochrome P450 [Cristinia sonorae]|uniref:Cytochrome P450 n=1 Tax=Cristinia sonorae TaxID=1940300 RepID=A0A8K0XJS2_9AGAR|nr:cytochrome P450 [Cristinia sonorae]
MLLTVTVVLSIVAVIVVQKIWWGSNITRLPFPPGPPRKWLVGNLLDFPKTRPWLTFREWTKEYGDIVYLDVPFKPIIVVGSVKVANDLLDGRSSMYSDRPYSPMIELLGWDWTITFMPNNSVWRTRRRYFHKYFGPSVLHQYHTILLQEIHAVLSRTLEQPDEVQQNIRNFPGSTIVRVAYGARDASQLREYVDLAERALETSRRFLVPGAFLVELFPVLRYLPSWLPGGDGKRFAEAYRPVVVEVQNKPFNEVKAAMAASKALPSVTYSLIREFQLEDVQGAMAEELDETAKSVVGSAYGAAADTTTAASEAFVLAMAMFPEVQRTAHAELDRVVGSSRLPDFRDLESLVYVRAVMLETIRWMPTVPTGIPHSASTDDEYNGYHIPKGTTVIVNAWAILHDPNDYPEPEKFMPERYLDKDGKIDLNVRDPTAVAFGFGRRKCAGFDFALISLHMFMASMLHVYRMEAGVDSLGQPLVLSGEGSDQGISSPITFPRHVRPRSVKAERLIRDIVLAEDFAGEQ